MAAAIFGRRGRDDEDDADGADAAEQCAGLETRLAEQPHFLFARPPLTGRGRGLKLPRHI